MTNNPITSYLVGFHLRGAGLRARLQNMSVDTNIYGDYSEKMAQMDQEDGFMSWGGRGSLDGPNSLFVIVYHVTYHFFETLLSITACFNSLLNVGSQSLGSARHRMKRHASKLQGQDSKTLAPIKCTAALSVETLAPISHFWAGMRAHIEEGKEILSCLCGISHALEVKFFEMSLLHDDM
ncbi:hypothetical protein BKA82DRAFT_4016155 [Pisolithus tinctorius]|nr:hypothetical protein BKA82DRAFT_4016155 [Pisolithus tinctorius]